MRNVEITLMIANHSTAPKIPCIKFIREALGLGLKDAKDLFETLYVGRRLRLTTEQFGMFVAMLSDHVTYGTVADEFEFRDAKLVPVERSDLIDLTRPNAPDGLAQVHSYSIESRSAA
jgi:hypothetical protein